jgi:hypothetical protein
MPQVYILYHGLEFDSDEKDRNIIHAPALINLQEKFKELVKKVRDPNTKKSVKYLFISMEKGWWEEDINQNYGQRNGLAAVGKRKLV